MFFFVLVIVYFQFQHSSKTLQHQKWWHSWCLYFSHWFQAILLETNKTPLSFFRKHLSNQNLGFPLLWQKPIFVIAVADRWTYDVCITFTYIRRPEICFLFAVLQPRSSNLLCCVTIKLNKKFCFHLNHVFFFFQNLNSFILNITQKTGRKSFLFSH